MKNKLIDLFVGTVGIILVSGVSYTFYLTFSGAAA